MHGRCPRGRPKMDTKYSRRLQDYLSSFFLTRLRQMLLQQYCTCTGCKTTHSDSFIADKAASKVNITILTDLLSEGRHTHGCSEKHRCLDASDTVLSASWLECAPSCETGCTDAQITIAHSSFQQQSTKNTTTMKKVLTETQTLRSGCSKVGQNFFAPLQTPLPVAQDSQNLISWWWSLPSPTDPVWWRSMHAVSRYHGNRHVVTHKHTHR